MHRSARRPVLVVAFFALTAACVPAASPRPDASGSAPASSAPASTAPGATASAGLPLVVDTDMAPDDVTAIASLLRDPGVDLRAITVVGTGEAHCPGGMFVARSVVTMLVDRPIPVACGNTSPIAAAEEFPADWRAGADAGGGLQLTRPSYLPDSRPAAEVLVDEARARATSGGQLTILTLGTLTNLANALQIDSDLPSKVRLVSMLGAVGVPGNVMTQPGLPTAEWNAHADPTAVRRILEAGFDWTLVPLDATNNAPLTPELLAELGSDHAAGPADLVFELWSRNSYMTSGGFYLWDPLASVVARDANVATVRPMRLSVTEGDGLDGGRLREDAAGHPATVAVSADQSRFEAMLLDRLRLGPPRSNSFTAVGSVEVTGGAGRCEATLDPASPPAGVLQIRVTNMGMERVSAVVFELGGATWDGIKAFTGAYNPRMTPPPVNLVAQVDAEAGATGSGYGTSPAGSLGIACVTGGQEHPSVTLAGPFPIGG